MNNIKQYISTYLKNNESLENVLGAFSIGEWLGEGGTSIVRNATLLSSGTGSFKPKLAIKFLAENINKKESKAYKRFKQAHINLLLIQNLGHVLPQIHFDTIEISEEITIPYIILKKADKTLKEYKSENIIDFELFVKIFDSLLNSIEVIHKNGIIHRDLKPENIFILDGKLVIGDFDIASFNDADGIKLVQTQAGDRLANYLFSAPEQSEKNFDEITTSADWYAFGQILFWLVHNKTLRGQGRISFQELDKRLAKYETLVAKLLQQNPNDRPQSKGEIDALLKENDKAYQDYLYRMKREGSLHKFDDIIYKYMSHLGMSGSEFQQFTDEQTINEIMSDLEKNQESLDLWFSQGYSDSSVKSIKRLNDPLCWLLDVYELKLKSIWIYKHFKSFGGSFLILETDLMPASGVYTSVEKVEEVGLFDNKHFVTRQEYDTGWAFIDGTRVKTLGKIELRVRTLEPDIHFLAPHWGPIVENIELFAQVYKTYCKTNILDEQILLPLKKIRRPREVRMYD